MFKGLIALFINLFLVLGFAYAEDNYTISGDVTFQQDKDIHICLLTKEGFREFHVKNHELSQPQYKVIKINADLKKAGKVSFKLDNIPRGTYCIITYQDVNNNGRVDQTNNISEPWGSYKKTDLSHATWDAVKFDLKEDITGIKINM